MDISINKIEDTLDKHLEAIAFLYQLTEKDISYARSHSNWDGKNLEHKLKLVAAVVAGRVAGMEPFPKVAKYPATFELSNAINKTSKLGILLWALGPDLVGVLSAKWGNRGKKIAVGGALGGVFDAPDNGSAPQQRDRLIVNAGIMPYGGSGR